MNDLIKIEEEKIKTANSTEKANILYNLIFLKAKSNSNSELYILSKQFFDSYINSIQTLNYGYDYFNFTKIEKLLTNLDYDKQISILQYVISLTSRELPEYDRSWFVQKKHKTEILKIFKTRDYFHFPKAILTFLGLNSNILLLTLSIILFITFIFLLPAKFQIFEFFTIEYHYYNSNFYLNHLFNIISLFACIENDFKIIPLNCLGFFCIILSKFVFTIFILNFIYLKISDKITNR